uniref:Uncharacterized protein n=1 Tax=Degsystermes virus TaxID=2796586 RepID=A0A7T7K8Y2_9VIRU|nr:hypothetical protein [Degsystermes virus]
MSAKRKRRQAKQQGLTNHNRQAPTHQEI